MILLGSGLSQDRVYVAQHARRRAGPIAVVAIIACARVDFKGPGRAAWVGVGGVVAAQQAWGADDSIAVVAGVACARVDDRRSRETAGVRGISVAC